MCGFKESPGPPKLVYSGEECLLWISENSAMIMTSGEKKEKKERNRQTLTQERETHQSIDSV